MSDSYHFGEEPRIVRPPDPAVERAKTVLLDEFFPANGSQVYYGRQLEVLLENRFFHWVTKRALNELAQAQTINERKAAAGHFEAHFYFPRRHRYAQRQIREMVGLIDEFSDSVFTSALGSHCEALVGIGMAQIGFRILGTEVRGVRGREWVRTGHNLDYIVENGGLLYGVEVKNQLGYMERDELEVKIEMCAHLEVRPLFIARMLPRSYMNIIYQAGGFGLLFGDQQYPLLAEGLAARVRSRLLLPVVVTRRFPDTALVRFERWHFKALEGQD